MITVEHTAEIDGRIVASTNAYTFPSMQLDDYTGLGYVSVLWKIDIASFWNCIKTLNRCIYVFIVFQKNSPPNIHEMWPALHTVDCPGEFCRWVSSRSDFYKYAITHKLAGTRAIFFACFDTVTRTVVQSFDVTHAYDSIRDAG